MHFHPSEVVLSSRRGCTFPRLGRFFVPSALVIELKNNKSAKAAIDQIKERNYPQQIEKYTGDMLLVGINYNEATKKHECRIKPWRKE